ncbi:helix-turn-helix transcriptional regulator [Parahaliea mediterranea]|uniref:Helix-turn-helix transcriptional regulator n=1 Tax=Parahaliea mediterranea TaxID=651086 RepID=A0A939DDZ2_9GAMM|nr:helix-turn-helix transcriptional regulator [Parahaliea mediterranea]MBN7796505.1 helix-turn-helix transcriptional regulator [Parahaliea mediterranea]
MQPPTLEQFNELLVALYRGPREDPPWGTFLQGLRELMDARITVLALTRPRPGDPGACFVSGMEVNDTSELQYADNYAALDPFLNLPDGKAVTLEEMIPMEELRQTPFYREWLLPSGNVQMLGLDILRDNTAGLLLRASRGERDSRFDEQDRTLFNLLGPHLRELLHLLDQSREQSVERDLYNRIASRLEVGMLMLNHQGAVVHSNPVANHLLARGDTLRLRNGKLVALRTGDNRRLRELIGGDSQDDRPALAQAMTLTPEQPGPALHLLVKPLPKVPPGDTSDAKLLVQDQERAPRTAIYISTPGLLTPEQQGILQQLFDFTPSEARLAIALANGLSLDDIAAQWNVTRNTLRTHLRGAFQKAGVNQQSALASLVLRSVAGLG